jgi:exosortase
MIIPRTYAIFAALSLLGTAVLWHPLVGTFSLALRRDEYTYILLIGPISAALIFLEWKQIKPTPQPTFQYGSVLLLLAALIGFFGSRWSVLALASDIKLCLSILALAIWWIGSFLCCFGARVSKRFIFPLCFLLLLAPAPEFVVIRTVVLLQQGSAVAAHLLFAAAGVPVVQEGLKLSIPGLIVEVAKECSSIRSSLMLLVTSAVLTQLLLTSFWRKILIVAIAVPLSIAKNGLRIFTIAMLGTRVDVRFLTGRLHHDGGVVFFSIALGVLFVLLEILRHAETSALTISSPRAAAEGLVVAQQ